MIDKFIKNLKETEMTNKFTAGKSEVFNYKDYEVTVCTDKIKGKEYKLILVLREAGKLEEKEIDYICKHFLGDNFTSQYAMNKTVFNAWNC